MSAAGGDPCPTWRAFPAGSRPIPVPDQHRDIARIGIVEELPGALVEHVGVDAVGSQKRDAVLPAYALGARGVELAREVGNARLEVLLRHDSVITGVGIEAEIADEERGERIEAERGEKGANPGRMTMVRLGYG